LEDSLGVEEIMTNLEDCTSEDSKPNSRKSRMESREENKELNQKDEKNFKEINLKIIAIN
jgi:hypothetical protein